MLTRLFYGPGDWIAERTTVRQRRAIAAWALIFWLGPGLALWLWLRNSLWFIGLMSIFALWWTGTTNVSGETPVESEGDG